MTSASRRPCFLRSMPHPVVHAVTQALVTSLPGESLIANCLHLSAGETRPQAALGLPQVKVTDLLPGPEARAGELVAALLERLAVDQLLLVPALDEPGVLQAGHHLVEGRGALALALLGQARAQLPA